MKRAEVWWVNFDPSVGGEIRKQRPAVIVSNDAANHFLNRVQVVPLTGAAGKLYPSEAYVTFSGRQSKAMAESSGSVMIRRKDGRTFTLQPLKTKVSPLDVPSIRKTISTEELVDLVRDERSRRGSTLRR